MKEAKNTPLPVGKIPENILKRSIVSAIKTGRDEVILGSAVGEDCAAIELSEDEAFVLSTDPITGTASDIGRLAVMVTANDLASAGAEPVGILLTALLPAGTTEADISIIMKDASDECAKANIQIIGGHTEITEAVNKPILSVTGVAKVKKDALITTGSADADMDLVVTKWIGLEGTSIIAKDHESELREHLPQSIIDRAKGFDEYISVVRDGRIAAKCGAAAMHDVTEGGIYGALWEMAEASGIGLTVELKDIPIRQETIEICEYYNIDPYRLISSGSMLIAAKDGEKIVKALSNESIPASVIGHTNASNDRLIRYDGKERHLTPPTADELYRVTDKTGE